MPQYHFNVFDGLERPESGGIDLPDHDGTYLVDIYAAQNEAVRYSGELLRELGAKFWNGAAWRMEVSNADGRILLILRFSGEEPVH